MTDLIQRLHDGPLKDKIYKSGSFYRYDALTMPTDGNLVELDWPLFGVIIEHARTLPNMQQSNFCVALQGLTGIYTIESNKMPAPLIVSNFDKVTPEMAAQALLEITDG